METTVKTAKINNINPEIMKNNPDETVSRVVTRIYELAQTEYLSGLQRIFVSLTKEERIAVILYAKTTAQLPSFIFFGPDIKNWLEHADGTMLKLDERAVKRLGGLFSFPGTEPEVLSPFSKMAVMAFFDWAKNYWQQDKMSMEEYAECLEQVFSNNVLVAAKTQNVI